MTFLKSIKHALLTRYTIQSVVAQREALARAYRVGVDLGRKGMLAAARAEIHQALSGVKLACADRDDAVAAMEGAHNAVFVLRKECEDRGIQIDNLKMYLADLDTRQCQCDTRGNH